ncbi:hypothetical protein C5E06_14765 [Pseudoclavibacter sp. RFBI5]|uniref:hypothetical protein n=1 Tax=Pseudoclavibacter sp. RFBI5 TaxID=2080578 RepID=UPI000CE83FF2|nr:hypothetical protein [Pseudoclavibacter sp. RFBI5]PPG01939.1 hypothetical protein C5E06_14765 [Pseudoclavibacter sp. RFBI5]
MRPPIYDNCERTDLTPQRNGETSFSFFNRAGGSLWRHSRALHQQWADRLSDREYAEMRAALRSDDAQARSAFLELYLHECLVRGSHEVVVHPKLGHTTRRPDFLASRGTTRVFIEAIAPGQSRADRAAANSIGALLATLDQVGDDNFLLMTTAITQASNSAPAARLRHQIRKWLTQLDPDSVDTEDLPKRTFEQDGWSVTIKAMPIKRSRRGNVRRSIGIYAHSEAHFIDDGAKLVAALKSKVSRYGHFDAPFVVAVGTTTFDEDGEDVFNALYGSVSWVLGGLTPGEEVTSRGVRNPDGYFGSPGAWKNRRVSAVLIVDQLSLHDPTRARVALWAHPDPLHPLPSEPMFPGVIHEWNGQSTDKREARDARRLLELAEDWPQGHRWQAD